MAPGQYSAGHVVHDDIIVHRLAAQTHHLDAHIMPYKKDGVESGVLVRGTQADAIEVGNILARNPALVAERDAAIQAPAKRERFSLDAVFADAARRFAVDPLRPAFASAANDQDVPARTLNNRASIRGTHATPERRYDAA